MIDFLSPRALGVTVLIGVLVFAATYAFSKEMEDSYIGAAPDRLYYVNTKTMVYTARDVVSAWNRIVPVKGSRYHERMQRLLKQHGEDHRRFAYLQQLKEVDCTESTVRTLSTIFYDHDDRIIHTLTDTKAAWEPVAAKSRGKQMLKAVCEGTGTDGRAFARRAGAQGLLLAGNQER